VFLCKQDFVIFYIIKELIMAKFISAKTKILNYLNKSEGYNTLSVAQARARFGISNVAARIDELRQEGNVIYTNTKRRADGSKVQVYRAGKPTKAMIRAAYAAGF
jgi:predicted ArsR family transcriptional regulator